jgi:hypothetical protein
MDAQKKMGLRIPGDEKVTVPARHWQAARLALWRSKHAWDIAMREAKQVLDRCEHAPECAGKGNETEVCQRDCPGREARLSALVILRTPRTSPRAANTSLRSSASSWRARPSSRRFAGRPSHPPTLSSPY